MFKTKKYLSIFLILFGLFLLVACDNGEVDPDPDPDPDDKVGVLTWDGLDDLLIAAGDRIDLLEGVTVTDSIDNDISDDVFILNEEDHGDILEDEGWLDDFMEFSPHMPGNYKVYYGVTNSTDVTEYKQRNVNVRLQHNVPNNDFSMDGYAWGFGIPGGAATLEYVDNQAVYTISNSGTEWWAIQHESNIRLVEGETYKISIVASSKNHRSIAFGFEDINNGYAMLASVTTHLLTDELTEYTHYYTANADYNNIKAVIYLGNQHQNDVVLAGTTQEVIVDSVYIEKVELNDTVTFEGQAGRHMLESGGFSLEEDAEKPFVDLASFVTAKVGEEDVTDKITTSGTISENVQGNTTYAIQYIIEFEDGSVAFTSKEFRVELVREFPHSTINGEFDSGFAGWTPDVNQTDGTGIGTFIDNRDGTITIDIEKNSGAAWHMQLFQAGINLTGGNTYQISFRAKASSEQSGNIEVPNPAANFADLLEPGQGTVVLTEEWQTFEIEFTVAETVNGLRLGFQFGRMDTGTVIDIDHFLINLVEDTETP